MRKLQREVNWLAWGHSRQPFSRIWIKLAPLLAPKTTKGLVGQSLQSETLELWENSSWSTGVQEGDMILLFTFIFILFFSAVPCSMLGVSSLTRGWICAPCIYLYLERWSPNHWTAREILIHLYSFFFFLIHTGNYIQYPVINHNGKEYEMEYIDV